MRLSSAIQAADRVDVRLWSEARHQGQKGDLSNL